MSWVSVREWVSPCHIWPCKGTFMSHGKGHACAVASRVQWRMCQAARAKCMWRSACAKCSCQTPIMWSCSHWSRDHAIIDHVINIANVIAFPQRLAPLELPAFFYVKELGGLTMVPWIWTFFFFFCTPRLFLGLQTDCIPSSTRGCPSSKQAAEHVLLALLLFSLHVLFTG